MLTRDHLKYKKRIVVKVGTSSLSFPNGKMNYQRIEELANVLSEVQKSGYELLLVSSGAIAVGAGRLGLTSRPSELASKQALAAIGQAELIRIYQKFFMAFDQNVAQVLLTRDGIENPMRRLNAKNTMKALLDMKIIPIINENDTVSTEEIEFGDNDTLSAVVSEMVEADLLILLSDIDGLYSSDPRKDSSATKIDEVSSITKTIEENATGVGSAFAKGGMATKISAAKICLAAGIEMVIASGENPAVVIDILEGKNTGTLFRTSKPEVPN